MNGSLIERIGAADDGNPDEPDADAEEGLDEAELAAEAAAEAEAIENEDTEGEE